MRTKSNVSDYLKHLSGLELYDRHKAGLVLEGDYSAECERRVAIKRKERQALEEAPFKKQREREADDLFIQQMVMLAKTQRARVTELADDPYTDDREPRPIIPTVTRKPFTGILTAEEIAIMRGQWIQGGRPGADFDKQLPAFRKALEAERDEQLGAAMRSADRQRTTDALLAHEAQLAANQRRLAESKK